jgi:hypothetical protein
VKLLNDEQVRNTQMKLDLLRKQLARLESEGLDVPVRQAAHSSLCRFISQLETEIAEYNQSKQGRRASA